jgi:uncharacterized protein
MRKEENRLHIYVRNLEEGEHELSQSWPAVVLGLPEFQDTLFLKGSLSKHNDKLLLHGSVRSSGSFECTRCNTPFEREFTGPLDLAFIPPSLHAEWDEPESEDENVHSYDPSQKAYIDITDDVRDSLALAVPMRNLCREDCRGICPNCGKNWNDGPCTCRTEETEIEDSSSVLGSALKGLSERLRAEENEQGKRDS